MLWLLIKTIDLSSENKAIMIIIIEVVLISNKFCFMKKVHL